MACVSMKLVALRVVAERYVASCVSMKLGPIKVVAQLL